MRRMLAGIVLALAARGAVAEPPAYKEVDTAKVPRTIAKEPAYVAAPLYALFILDSAGDFRVWVVLDKSKKDVGSYDVVYFDRNGNGDLTEDGERVTAPYRKEGEPAGTAIDLQIGDVVVPGTGEKHTDFRLWPVAKEGRKGVCFQMKWRGRVEMSGGYGSSGFDTTEWGASPEKAPILRPTPEGPLVFGLWGSKPLVLRAGEECHLAVIAGHAGAGESSTCVVDENYLDLDKDALWVTVVAWDASGSEVRERIRIRHHC